MEDFEYKFYEGYDPYENGASASSGATKLRSWMIIGLVVFGLVAWWLH